MKEKIKPKESFTKDRDNLEMLRQSLKSEEIDKDIIPILEKFFSLPITPRESCYGHAKTLKEPYLSYVEDGIQSEQDENFQELFKEKITELTTKINQRIGNETVNIVLEKIDRDGGPKDYTLRFEIIDKENFQKFDEKFLDIIWDEFSRYLDELR
ncbi:hypothetical protein KKF32_01450 [Patescibacteria group bacterium]|nr:hypothetical protein [Patescibacteria group bacterium]